jgi:hypothetical protein
MPCVLRADSRVVDGAHEDGFAGLQRFVRARNSWLLKRNLTAYVRRSPFGSEERWVCCPREVVGAAAHMASGISPSVEGQSTWDEIATSLKRHGP